MEGKRRKESEFQGGGRFLPAFSKRKWKIKGSKGKKKKWSYCRRGGGGGKGDLSL